MGLAERLSAAMGRMFARKVTPNAYPEIRFVPFGNTAFKIRTPEDALKVATAWRCVSLISSTVGSLDWVVRQRVEGTSKDRRDSPVQWLLANEPNEEMGALDFRRTLVSHLLLYGNGYAEIQRDRRGRPAALWIIGPDRVEPQRDQDGRLFYQISNPQGGTSQLDPRDVFHVRGLGWDGIRGYSIMETGTDTLRAARALDGFAGSFFSNGMLPSAVIEVPRELALSPDAVRKIQAELVERHQGPGKAGRPLVLDAGMSFKSMSVDPEKSQFIDTKKLTVYDICRLFGVPPYLAFASDEQPRANVETQSREFYSYGLLPIIRAFEQEANRKLLAREFAGFYSEMNTDQLLRGDYQTIAQYYKTMREIGVFTINDVLRMEGMDTVGPEGDVRHMQVQNQPVAGPLQDSADASETQTGGAVDGQAG